jgi:hypothetical protein
MTAATSATEPAPAADIAALDRLRIGANAV